MAGCVFLFWYYVIGKTHCLYQTILHVKWNNRLNGQLIFSVVRKSNSAMVSLVICLVSTAQMVILTLATILPLYSLISMPK